MKTIKIITLSSVILAASLIGCKGYEANTLSITKTQTTEEQLYRPNFHFTPNANWMNDPNGLCYADGYYHLYFQYYPDGNIWGPMHWGHAKSKDMIKWEEQPIAIYPGSEGWIFSGSAVVDIKNTSGFGNGKNPPMVAIYTIHSQEKEKAGQVDIESQGIAYSNDNGQTWTKYANNPVIKNPGIRDFRDPKLTWDAIHNQWILVLAAQDRSKFYRSSDLKNWEELSEFGQNIGAHGGVWECPDFFSMKVENSNETKWVLIQSLNPGGPNGGSGTQYFIGDFDGRSFTADPKFLTEVKNKNGVWIDYGKDNYAGVTWNNIPQKDGRRLMIGWMSNWNYATVVPTQKWRSSMTLPRELKLIKKNGDYKIVSTPIKEIKRYVSKTSTQKNIVVEAKKVLAESPKTNLTLADITIRINNLKAETYSFSLSNQAGESITFGLNNKEDYLFLDRSKSGNLTFSDKFAAAVTKAIFDAKQTNAELRLLIDKTSIEIFYNDGEKVITEIFFPSTPYTILSAEATTTTTIDLTINQLQIK